MRWAAMLRGINLGKRQLKKDDLIAAAAACGYRETKTLLASGNLVFEADGEAEAIERDLSAAVKRLHGIDSKVFVRNQAEMAAVIAANPFTNAAEARPSFLLVTFHDAPFSPTLLDVLAGRHTGPKRIAAIGRELFVDFPEGQARSELVPTMAKCKFPHGTGRNWNTVVKLAGMLA